MDQSYNLDSSSVVVVTDTETDQEDSPEPRRQVKRRESLSAARGGARSLEASDDEKDGSNTVADISLNMSMSQVPQEVEDPDPETQALVDRNLALMTDFLPWVDPTFLLERARHFGEDEKELQRFIAGSLERKGSLPSRKELDKKAELQREQMRIRKLKPRDFLAEFEDPQRHYMTSKAVVGEDYRQHTVFYLRKHFPTHTQDQVTAHHLTTWIRLVKQAR